MGGWGPGSGSIAFQSSDVPPFPEAGLNGMNSSIWEHFASGSFSPGTSPAFLSGPGAAELARLRQELEEANSTIKQWEESWKQAKQVLRPHTHLTSQGLVGSSLSPSYTEQARGGRPRVLEDRAEFQNSRPGIPSVGCLFGLMPQHCFAPPRSPDFPGCSRFRDGPCVQLQPGCSRRCWPACPARPGTPPPCWPEPPSPPTEGLLQISKPPFSAGSVSPSPGPPQALPRQLSPLSSRACGHKWPL